MAKKAKKTSRPDPYRIAFGQRVREMLRALHRMRQADLAKILGGQADMVSRIVKAKNTGITYRTLGRLVQFAVGQGISLRWLLAGQGDMFSPERHAARSPSELLAASRAQLTVELGRALTRKMLVEELLRTVDDKDARREVLEAFRIASPARQGAAAGPETPAAAKPAPPAEKTGAVSPPSYEVTAMYEPGYCTVAPEDLPDDWRGLYVPVLGHLAAGEGIEPVEASEHPPGWAASYIRYVGAPAGAFAVQIAGQSMVPDYGDGDMIVVDPREPVADGLCCAIWDVDGERRVALKILTRHGRKAVLASINPAFPAFDIPAKSLVAAYSVADHLPRVVARRRPPPGGPGRKR